MGFVPQFVDLDQDGHLDIISGSYFGYVNWFRGIDLDKYSGGFDVGQFLDQEGDPKDVENSVSNYNKDPNDVKSSSYWTYSPASFGDFTGDGLLDLIVGGSSLRISENIGTKEKPKFAKRKLLLDINGIPLNPQELTEPEKKAQRFGPLCTQVVVDWDNDGQLDILASTFYVKRGRPVVVFFKGVNTAKGYRFEPGISLFEAKDGSKAFPGKKPHINVCDWNNDGVMDLLIGTSVVALQDNKFCGLLSWNWESETGLNYSIYYLRDNPGTQKYYLNKYLKSKTIKEKVPAEDFLNIRHIGYIYVMLGEK